MNENEIKKIILEHCNKLMQNGRFSLEKTFIQHGSNSVYDHSLNVAYLSTKIALKIKSKIDLHKLINGALLHDYFLYDWHIHKSIPFTHGFTHPFTALKNAKSDFVLTRTEEDIIKHHMFPLVPFPPHTKEGFIVCLADKICAVFETFNFRFLRKYAFNCVM